MLGFVSQPNLQFLPGVRLTGRLGARFEFPNITTRRILCTTEELRTCIGARFGGAKNQRATAFWTCSRAGETLLECSNVLSACCPALGKHAIFQRDGNLLNVLVREQYGRMALDVRNVASTHDTWRKRRLEFALAPEHNNRYEFAVIDT